MTKGKLNEGMVTGDIGGHDNNPTDVAAGKTTGAAVMSATNDKENKYKLKAKALLQAALNKKKTDKIIK